MVFLIIRSLDVHQHFVPDSIPAECELRDVIHSFTPVLLDLCFFLKMVANSVSHILLISLILAKFRYWQDMFSPYLESFNPAFCAES